MYYLPLVPKETLKTIRLKFIQLGFNDINGEFDDNVLQKIPQPVIKHDITIYLKKSLLKYGRTTSTQLLTGSYPQSGQVYILSSPRTCLCLC
jgi:hypothetical protein